MYEANAQIEKIELEQIKFIVKSKIDARSVCAYNMQLGRFVDHMTNEIAFEFSACVLGERQKPIELGSEPYTWWQMFKRDVMPRWFCKKFPVKHREFRRIEVITLYPDLKVSVPSHMSRVVILAQSMLS